MPRVHWCYKFGRYACCCIPGCRGSTRAATVTASGRCCRAVLRGSGVKQIWRTISMPMQMFVALVCGMIIGFSLYYKLHPTDPKYLKEVAKWVGWPGIIFIRLMKCIDLPLIMVNIMVGVSGVAKFGLAGRMGILSGVAYLILAILASLTGLVSFIALETIWFQQYPDNARRRASMALACGSGADEGYMSLSNGAFVCVPEPNTFDQIETDESDAKSHAFPISVFGDSILQAEPPPTTPGDVAHYVLDGLTPSNALEAFVDDNVLGVIAIAIVLGLAIVRIEPAGGQQRNVVADLVLQLRSALTMIGASFMKWLGPIGAMSLVAAAFATVEDPLRDLANYAGLALALILGFAAMVGVIIPVIFVVIAGGNPFRYFWLFLASFKDVLQKRHVDDEVLEQSIETAVEQGRVSGMAAGFCLSLGSDFSLAGNGIYYSTAVLYLCKISGAYGLISGGTMVIIGIVSVASVIGAKHFPNYGLIMLLTVWAACFGNMSKPPPQIGVLLTLDWLFQLGITLTNLLCDTAIAKIVDELLNDGTEDLQRASTIADRSSARIDTASLKAIFADESVSSGHMGSGSRAASFLLAHSTKNAFLRDSDSAGKPALAVGGVGDPAEVMLASPTALDRLPRGSARDLIKLMNRGSLVAVAPPRDPILSASRRTRISAAQKVHGAGGFIGLSPSAQPSARTSLAPVLENAASTDSSIDTSSPLSTVVTNALSSFPEDSDGIGTSTAINPARASMLTKRRSLAVEEGLQMLTIFGSSVRRLDAQQSSKDRGEEEDKDRSSSDDDETPGSSQQAQASAAKKRFSFTGGGLQLAGLFDSPGLYSHKHHSSFYHVSGAAAPSAAPVGSVLAATATADSTSGGAGGGAVALASEEDMDVSVSVVPSLSAVSAQARASFAKRGAGGGGGVTSSANDHDTTTNPLHALLKEKERQQQAQGVQMVDKKASTAATTTTTTASSAVVVVPNPISSSLASSAVQQPAVQVLSPAPAPLPGQSPAPAPAPVQSPAPAPAPAPTTPVTAATAITAATVTVKATSPPPALASSIAGASSALSSPSSSSRSIRPSIAALRSASSSLRGVAAAAAAADKAAPTPAPAPVAAAAAAGHGTVHGSHHHHRATRGSVYRNHTLAMVKQIREGLTVHVGAVGPSPSSSSSSSSSASSVHGAAAAGTGDRRSVGSPSSTGAGSGSPEITTTSSSSSGGGGGGDQAVKALLSQQADMAAAMARMQEELARLRAASTGGGGDSATGARKRQEQQQQPALKEEEGGDHDDE